MKTTPTGLPDALSAAFSAAYLPSQAKSSRNCFSCASSATAGAAESATGNAATATRERRVKWVIVGLLSTLATPRQSGREEGRGRGFQYGCMWVVAVSLQTKKKNKT